MLEFTCFMLLSVSTNRALQDLQDASNRNNLSVSNLKSSRHYIFQSYLTRILCQKRKSIFTYKSRKSYVIKLEIRQIMDRMLQGFGEWPARDVLIYDMPGFCPRHLLDKVPSLLETKSFSNDIHNLFEAVGPKVPSLLFHLCSLYHEMQMST